MFILAIVPLISYQLSIRLNFNNLIWNSTIRYIKRDILLFFLFLSFLLAPAAAGVDPSLLHVGHLTGRKWAKSCNNLLYFYKTTTTRMRWFRKRIFSPFVFPFTPSFDFTFDVVLYLFYTITKFGLHHERKLHDHF